MEQLVSNQITHSQRWAYRLIIVALLLPAILFALIAIDMVWRSAHQDQAAVRWMRALDLCVPAFQPSGSPQRHPAALPPGFDLRLSPLLGGAERTYKGTTGAGEFP